MILRYIIFLPLLCLVYSDDHIPRQIETVEKPVPVSDFNAVISDSDDSRNIKDISDLDNAHNMNNADEPHKESSIKSLNDIKEDQKLPNAGSEFFRDSSYVTFTTLIGKRSVDCFFYKARKSFDVDFQVLKGGDFDIAVTIYDNNNKQVSFNKPAGDGTLKVVVPTTMVNTDYSICLDNQQSSWHAKKVFIMIDVEGPNGVNHPDLQTGEYAQIQNHMTKLDMMNMALSSVYESLMKVEQHQERRRLVEAIDRSIMESNFEYVTFWAFVQIGMMVIVAALQLVMIRSLFDANYAGIGKIWKKLNELTGGRF